VARYLRRLPTRKAAPFDSFPVVHSVHSDVINIHYHSPDDSLPKNPWESVPFESASLDCRKTRCEPVMSLLSSRLQRTPVCTYPMTVKPASKDAPFRLLHLPSKTSDENNTVLAISVMASNTVNDKSISRPIAHPISTTSGTTKSPICIALPMDTANARSICLLQANMMPEMSSAAFPTTGNRIRPTVVLDTEDCSTKRSIAPTRSSPQKDMRAVDMTNMTIGSTLWTQSLFLATSMTAENFEYDDPGG